MGDSAITGKSVLVVDAREDELERILSILEAEGYRAFGASCFEDGRRLLSTLDPLVLLTSVKLGRHNGLHLVVRARLSRPQLAAIVTHHVFDSVLEAEANRQDAKFVVNPCSPAELMGHVHSAAETALRARRPAR